MNPFFYNHFNYPRKHVAGKILSSMLNNICFLKLKRVFFYPFSKAILHSDITNVVYLNWFVPFGKIEHLVPKHIKLKQYNGNVLFTILTYKHGNFGPKFLSKIKPCFSSPLQSNWRVYIENNVDFGIKESAIFFVKNCIDNKLYALGSRMFSNILQTHLPLVFKHVEEEGIITTEITSGFGAAPDLLVQTKRITDWSLPSVFESISPDREKLITMICNQDYAVANQPEKDIYAVARIRLQFDPSTIQPLQVISIKSDWLGAIIEGAPCFAFIIPFVTFTTLKEQLHKVS